MINFDLIAEIDDLRVFEWQFGIMIRFNDAALISERKRLKKPSRAPALPIV